MSWSVPQYSDIDVVSSSEYEARVLSFEYPADASINFYIYVVTMAMDGRLKASVVICSVEAHESQEVDHVMRRGLGISSFSIVYHYTSHRLTVSVVYCN